MDSTACEVHGHHKQGAAYSYTRQLGYHPLPGPPAPTPARCSTPASTGRAASGRGAERFVVELAGRLRRAGATGLLTLRADSGFWSARVLAACRRHNIRFTITVRQTKTVAAAIAAIDMTSNGWPTQSPPPMCLAVSNDGHPELRSAVDGTTRVPHRLDRLRELDSSRGGVASGEGPQGHQTYRQ